MQPVDYVLYKNYSESGGPLELGALFIQLPRPGLQTDEIAFMFVFL